MAFPFGFWMLTSFVFAGIGMDTCVIPLRHGGLSLVQTTDYIYPIVDDPYMMVSLTLPCVYTWNCLLDGFGAGAGDLAFYTPVVTPPRSAFSLAAIGSALVVPHTGRKAEKAEEADAGSPSAALLPACVSVHEHLLCPQHVC